MGERTKKQAKQPRCNVPNRTVFCHDNLGILQGINTECIDLIYLDPPFNKKKVFVAPIGTQAEGASFKDIFTQEDLKDEWVDAIEQDQPAIHEFLSAVKSIEGRTSYNFCYLAYMAIRLIECHRVLKQTGSVYLHCDPTMSHYLKLMMDCIFGEKQFRNEVVWLYEGRELSKKNYNKKHDVILYYTKSNNWVFHWHDVGTPLKEKLEESNVQVHRRHRHAVHFTIQRRRRICAKRKGGRGHGLQARCARQNTTQGLDTY